MLVVRIEMWPGGDAKRAHTIGVATITNDGKGTPTVGNYVVRLFKKLRAGDTRPLDRVVLFARAADVWRSGRVDGFPRARLGPYDLLLRALAACAGSRSAAAAACTGEVGAEDFAQEYAADFVTDPFEGLK